MNHDPHRKFNGLFYQPLADIGLRLSADLAEFAVSECLDLVLHNSLCVCARALSSDDVGYAGYTVCRVSCQLQTPAAAMAVAA